MAELTAVVHDASEIVVGPGDDALLERHGDGAVAIVDGRVAVVGRTDEITAEYPPENAIQAIDAQGKSVIPGSSIHTPTRCSWATVRTSSRPSCAERHTRRSWPRAAVFSGPCAPSGRRATSNSW